MEGTFELSLGIKVNIHPAVYKFTIQYGIGEYSSFVNLGLYPDAIVGFVHDTGF
jgi:hypothetical protein